MSASKRTRMRGAPPKPLAEAGKALGQRWKAADSSNIEEKYGIATEIKRLLAIAAYGHRVAEKLAKAAGKSKSMVFAYNKVAEVWTKRALNKVLKDTRGQLTWSNLVELAALDSVDRDVAIGQVKASGTVPRKFRSSVGPQTGGRSSRRVASSISASELGGWVTNFAASMTSHAQTPSDAEIKIVEGAVAELTKLLADLHARVRADATQTAPVADDDDVVGPLPDQSP